MSIFVRRESVVIPAMDQRRCKGAWIASTDARRLEAIRATFRFHDGVYIIHFEFAEPLYFTYSQFMARLPNASPPPSKDSLSVELGGWFKAHATGAGVIAIPVIVVVVAAVAVAQGWIG